MVQSKPVEELEKEADVNPLLRHVLALDELSVIEEVYKANPDNLTSAVLLTACLDGAKPGVIAFLARAKPELAKVGAPWVFGEYDYNDSECRGGRLPVHCALHCILTCRDPAINVPSFEDIKALLEIFPKSVDIDDPCTDRSPLKACVQGNVNLETIMYAFSTHGCSTYSQSSLCFDFNQDTSDIVNLRHGFDQDCVKALSMLMRGTTVRECDFEFGRVHDEAFGDLFFTLLVNKSITKCSIEVSSLTSPGGGQPNVQRICNSVSRTARHGESALEKLKLALPDEGGWDIVYSLCQLPNSRLTSLKLQVRQVSDAAVPALSLVLGGETSVRRFELSSHFGCEINLDPLLDLLRVNTTLESLLVEVGYNEDKHKIAHWKKHLGTVVEEDNCSLIAASVVGRSYRFSLRRNKSRKLSNLDYFLKLNRCGRRVLKQKESCLVEDLVESLGYLVVDEGNYSMQHNDLLEANTYFWLLREGLELWVPSPASLA
ncbi:expressed unknown protein [Seminavis robusta]|uniref:Uncharacterized protein n=1 Tax=Seminavis robusta TaxID=568900 RepID=A0A9N8DY83_9STRA|nr:expressed unknown protein [Seminavis robusta]|eukprot:Sro385_g131780.1 n/a (488) ;mRNA; r:66818-68281